MARPEAICDWTWNRESWVRVILPSAVCDWRMLGIRARLPGMADMGGSRMAAGYWPLAVGFWLLAGGGSRWCWLSMPGQQPVSRYGDQGLHHFVDGGDE